MTELQINFYTLFYNATNIPLTFFDVTGKYITSFPKEPHLMQPPFLLSENSKNPDFFTSASHGFYGIIRHSDGTGFLLLGPTYNVPVTNTIIRTFMRENAIPLDQKEITSSLLLAAPTLTFSEFLNNLMFLYFCITQEYKKAEDHFDMFDISKMSLLQRKNVEKKVEDKENHRFHNSYSWEQNMYHLIQSGDTEKLRDFLSQNINYSALTEGIMADSPLRQAKNLFIGTITKIGMLAAIPGGLDVEQTYQLIDNYTRECEKQLSITSIQDLYYTSAMDFCARLSENNVPEGISNEVYACMCYIRNHINENLSITDVANKVHRSNSYIINKFKSELGINIGAYISRCKLEEAKSLLSYSDKSLSYISNYLCFSSQSYFQNVFKKKYGVTPMQYRKQHHTSNII